MDQGKGAGEHARTHGRQTTTAVAMVQPDGSSATAADATSHLLQISLDHGVHCGPKCFNGCNALRLRSFPSSGGLPVRSIIITTTAAAATTTTLEQRHGQLATCLPDELEPVQQSCAKRRAHRAAPTIAAVTS